MDTNIFLNSLNGLNSGVLILDRSFLVKFANKFVQKLLFLSEIEYEGNNLKNFLNSDDHAQIIEYLNSSKDYKQKITITQKDGRDIPLFIRRNFEEGSGNQFIYIEFRETDAVIYNKSYDSINESLGINCSNGDKCFSEFAEQIPALVFEQDETGLINFVNKEGLERLGYALEDFKILNPLKLFPENKLDEIRVKFYSLINGTPLLNYETDVVRKDGTMFPVKVFAQPIIMKDKVKGVRGFFLDQTESKKNLSLALENEKKFQAIFDEITYLNLLVDNQGKILYCNDFFLDNTGYNRDEIIGSDWFDKLIPEDDKDKMYESYTDSIFGSGLPDTQENVILRKDEKRILISWDNVKLKDNDGKYYATACIGSDITEKREAEIKLKIYQNQLEELIEKRTSKLQELNLRLNEEYENIRNAEEKLRDQYSLLNTILDTVPIPIYVKDKSDKMLLVNDELCKIINKTKEEVIGNFTEHILTKENAAKFSKFNEELLTEPDKIKYEIDYYNKNNEAKSVLVSKATLVKNNGEITGIVGVISDITKQKKIQKLLKTALKKEKELNELKNNFIASTSHEFRTPLTSILSAADILGMFKDKIDEKKYYELINVIQSSVENLNTLITELHSIKETGINENKITKENFSLNEFIDQIKNEFNITNAKQIIWKIQIANKRDTVNADKKLLRQIIANLLYNSLKYSQSKSKIECTVKLTSEDILLNIKDNGIGISSEEIKNIYEPFYRCNNVGNKPGSGLGLSIVKNAVDLHHGKISCKSKLNSGTVFKILIPRDFKEMRDMDV